MKTLPFLFLLFSLSLSAQYSNISLLDQLRLEIEERDASGDKLLAGNMADVSQVEGVDKVEFLQKAIVSLAIERYSTYSGDPYAYKAFGAATLRDLSNEPYPLGSVNYNAYSGRIEYKKGEDWIEFRPDYFPRVDFGGVGEVARSMVYGLLPDYPAHYSELLFKGNRVRAASHRKVHVFENKTYAASPIAARFAPKDYLYLYVDDQWVASSYKAKTLARDLGYPNEITGFIKSEKLDTRKPADLKKILTYADRLK